MTAASPDIVLLRRLASHLENQGLVPSKRSRLTGDQTVRRLQYSERFLDAYRRLVAVAIPRRLTRAFGWRRFHRLEDDETRQVTVSDREFWSDMPARFTAAGTDAMWQMVSGEVPDVAECTEWDALVAWMAWPGPASRFFGHSWLAGRETHWMVSAYAVCHRSYRVPDTLAEGLPWLAYFAHPSRVPFTLRFVLLEATAAVYDWAARTLSRSFDRAEEAHFEAPHGQRLPIHDPRHPDYFRWARDAEARLGLSDVERAVGYWSGEGMRGYDDDRFVRAVAEDHDLFTSIATIRDQLRRFGRSTGRSTP